MPSKVNIAVVGLGFGAAFAPIYQAHPDVGLVVLCDPDERRLQSLGESLEIPPEYLFTSLDEVLACGEIDAVHLLSPVPIHVEQTLAVLAAGKHCACAVIMATELEGLRQIIKAQKRSGKNYMMMETAVYTREFLYAQDLVRRGELGELTFLRGTYFQDIEGNYPDYWHAMAPMIYGTHAIAPVLALANSRAESVCCFGSGRLRADIQQTGGNVFPLQTAIFQLEGGELAAEVTRSWFQTARTYTEAFSVYGDSKGFEWNLEHEEPILYTLEPLVSPQHRGRHARAERVTPLDRHELIPPEIARFTQHGHGGSHPHLAHEFVRSIVEGRPAAIDAVSAANWTAAGICANESSLRNGERVDIPDFTKD